MRFLRMRLILGLMTMTALAWAGAEERSGITSGNSDGMFHGTNPPSLVIIDTDIGDDIDDAFALALALKSPELDILGITTAFGDTELRARLLDRYLKAILRNDIPVAAGVKTAANNVFTQSAYTRAQPSPCLDLRTATIESNNACLPGALNHQDAVGFLLDQIRSHPGEITLIAIGPLTNVEAAIKRDPQTFRKLKRVVMMGGSIYRGYGVGRPPEAEWNIKCDPAGLRALLASGVPIFMMPLDSTQIHLETRDREQIFAHGSPLTDQLTLLYHQWSANAGDHPTTPTLFDPVAVTYAIRPDLCPATPIRIEVDDRGFTRPVDGAPNAQVCLKSDEKGFLDLLLGRLTQDEQR